MTSSKKKPGEQLITVDAGKLSHGLKATFEGVAMIFDSLGVDAGFDVTEKEEDKAGKKSAGRAKEDKAVEPVPEMKDEVEEPAAETAGNDAAAVDAGKTAPDAVMDPAVEESDEATETEPEKHKNPENPENSAPAISLDDVTKIIVQKIKQDRGNNQKIGQILKTYGVAKVGELDPKKYEAFLTDLAAL